MWGDATYTTTYNKAVTADVEAGISAWNAESDITSSEWTLNNEESNMALSVNATKGLLFSIGKGNTGSNFATKTFSAVPTDGVVLYDVSWRTVRQYGKDKGTNNTCSFIQFGDQFRLSTGFSYYADQPLYVNYDGTSSTVNQVMSKITSNANHSIIVKINCKSKEILLFMVDGTDYTSNINTTLTGSVFNTLTIGSNKATANSWDIEMCSLISAKVSYLENGIKTWNFLDTNVWGNYTRDGASANYKDSATGNEVWFSPDGSTATSITSNISFKFANDKARFNYGGTKGLGLAQSYDSENDINYVKIVVPANNQVIVDYQTGSTGRPIVFNLEGVVVGTYKTSGTYSYTNDGDEAVTLKVYGTNVKDDYSTNTIRKITLVDCDKTDVNNYTVNAVDEEGNVLKKLATGTAIPYNAYSVNGIPYVISKDGLFYELSDDNASNLSKTFTMGEAYAVNTVSYTLNSDIVFFQEYESLNANGGRINSQASTGASNGNGAYIGYTSATAITNATSNSISTTGVYDVMVRACDRSGKTQTKTLYLTDGTTDTEIGILSSSGNNSSWSTTTLTKVTIASGQYFKLLTSNSSSNDTFVGDYILLKNSKEQVSLTNGFATYVNHDFALDFTDVEGLTAYTATVKDANTVTFTPATKVPAGTGLLLKGATADVPVIASTEEITGNVLYAPTEEVTGLTYDDGTYYNYILTKVSDKVGFYKANNNKVAVGKAYLRIPQTGLARELTFIGFDDDNTTTGIEAVGSSQMAIDRVYNIQGQLVNQPRKGLYIVNGKKVIIK